MSLLSRLFGGGKDSAAKSMSPADAIQRLREVEEMLEKKQQFLEKKVEAELESAKKNGTKNKRGKFTARSRSRSINVRLGFARSLYFPSTMSSIPWHAGSNVET